MADTPSEKKNGGGEGKELSMETRLLLAFILMGAVLFLTPYIYKQQQPAKSPAKTAETAKIAQAPATSAPAPEGAPASPPESVQATPVPGRIATDKEESYTVDTSFYQIRFSNRGGVVTSWVLKKFRNAEGKPLELVNSNAVAKVGYPFALVFADRKPGVDLNQSLYVGKAAPDGLGVDFEYSDGSVLSRKSFRFEKSSYISRVSSEVVSGGATIPHKLSWRGGFGDASVDKAETRMHSIYYDAAAGKLVVQEAKLAKDGPVTSTGSYSFAGMEDSYFAAVFFSSSSNNPGLTTFSDTVPTVFGKKDEPHVGAAVGGGGRNEFSLFVGPKDMDILRALDPRLERLVDFGWFAFLAKPLFLGLNWLHDRYVHNYGWAIILITVIINFALLPLKLTSMKSMKKMQALQPQIAAINEKYKGIGLRDPKKAQQNQEVMDLYKKHGVNPMGGCLPMVLQLPFFFAFYKVLSVAIELRGAEWLWVKDLSSPESLPIHILPIAMIASQFVMQKMTPSTGGDPAQQKMMMFMPLVLGFMFYNVSSGLVLYWLTGNLVGIAQQWFINKTTPNVAIPQPLPAKAKKAGRK